MFLRCPAAVAPAERPIARARISVRHAARTYRLVVPVRPVALHKERLPLDSAIAVANHSLLNRVSGLSRDRCEQHARPGKAPPESRPPARKRLLPARDKVATKRNPQTTLPAVSG